MGRPQYIAYCFIFSIKPEILATLNRIIRVIGAKSRAEGVARIQVPILYVDLQIYAELILIKYPLPKLLSINYMIDIFNSEKMHLVGNE